VLCVWLGLAAAAAAETEATRTLGMLFYTLLRDGSGTTVDRFVASPSAALIKLKLKLN